MGIFDFFKRKEKTQPEKPVVKAKDKGEFDLQLTDFNEKIHKAKAIADAWIDPAFESEFAHLKTGEPSKKGDIIELKIYVANVALWGNKVELTFDPVIASKDINDFVQKINKQLDWLTKNKSLIKKAITSDLLQLKNESWLDEDQQTINKEDFIKPIQLTSVDFAKKAAFDLYFDDGNLFWGHSIILNVNSKREIKGASIAG